MPRERFTTEECRRGGQHPASELQRAIATQTIRRTKPWEQSTGAKTIKGKFHSSLNAYSGWHKTVESSSLDYESECQKLRSAVAELQKLAPKHCFKGVIQGCEVSLKVVIQANLKDGVDGRDHWLTAKVKAQINLAVRGHSDKFELAKPICEEMKRKAHEAIATILERFQ
ncbi:MAG: hypothetical protein SFY66_10820 [Oculatellaceae cyanobacterium bins.114]|nr:hypothetical protein [Oculatellaceae cyanobacterium bins.114]